MNIGQRWSRMRWVILGLALVLALTSGCGLPTYSTKYPDDLKYPAREDVLVTEKLAGNPRRLPPPGQIDDTIKAGMAGDPPAAKKCYLPSDLPADKRQELQDALELIFGTPARPTVEPNEAPKAFEEEKFFAREGSSARKLDRVEFPDEKDTPQKVTLDHLDALQLDPGTLARGSRLYRRHCLHCHGLSGDGRGPTGPWVSPHPRDYRQGKFKFISSALKVTAATRKPRRADIHRVIAQGVDGTSMPAFGLLPDEEISALVSYVIHLSIRGETEFEVIKTYLETKGTVPGFEKKFVNLVYSKAARTQVFWAAHNAAKPDTPAEKYPDVYHVDATGLDKAQRDEREKHLKDSIDRGHKLFAKNCLSCHLDYGRQAPYNYDAWGTLVKPRNLTESTYRGGRRPIDLYWRISGGIDASGMSVHNQAGGGPFNGKDMWDVVNFVQALPYPNMLPKDVQDKIYGTR